MEKSFVSIIIPAYNVGSYLEECVNAFLSQTYINYEIIIIDDGSTDDTYTIGEKIALQNNKVKIIHQENQGVSIARNVGIQNACGEYYIFADADDVVAPQYIETLAVCIEKSDMGMIGYTSNINELSFDVITNLVYNRAENVIENILLGTNYDGYLWNKIFRRSIIEKSNLMFRKNITVWEDLLFVLEYLRNCTEVSISDEKLYYYRYREGSAVNNNRIDKYRSKYEAMAEIKKQRFSQTSQSKKRISFLFFETMFSYLNQLIIRKDNLIEAKSVLSNLKIVELIKQKNALLILKYLYLRIKTNF